MKNQTVTSELRKSILKVVPTFICYGIFSDSRMNKTAVGAKVCGHHFTIEQISSICEDMVNKGFKFKVVKSIYHGNFRGTRFTFFKKLN